MLRSMLRPALIAVLGLLVAAPAALGQSTRNQILRECQSGNLSGDYTSREIRDARSNIPDDVDQYTDCRDVLSRALLALAGGGGDTGGALLTPSTDADRQALEHAATDGAQPVEVAGRKITPGTAHNDIPTTLLVLLILIAAGTVAALAPQFRRLAVVRRVIPGRSG